LTYPIPEVRVPARLLAFVDEALGDVQTSTGHTEHLWWWSVLAPEGLTNDTHGDDNPVREQSLEGNTHDCDARITSLENKSSMISRKWAI
jgi:hypothetical protein